VRDAVIGGTGFGGRALRVSLSKETGCPTSIVQSQEVLVIDKKNGYTKHTQHTVTRKNKK